MIRNIDIFGEFSLFFHDFPRLANVLVHLNPTLISSSIKGQPPGERQLGAWRRKTWLTIWVFSSIIVGKLASSFRNKSNYQICLEFIQRTEHFFPPQVPM